MGKQQTTTAKCPEGGCAYGQNGHCVRCGAGQETTTSMTAPNPLPAQLAQVTRELDAAREDAKRLREIAVEFCRRVEAGEIRSKRTYAAFKATLAQQEPSP